MKEDREGEKCELRRKNLRRGMVEEGKRVKNRGGSESLERKLGEE